MKRPSFRIILVSAVILGHSLGLFVSGCFLTTQSQYHLYRHHLGPVSTITLLIAASRPHLCISSPVWCSLQGLVWNRLSIPYSVHMSCSLLNQHTAILAFRQGLFFSLWSWKGLSFVSCCPFYQETAFFHSPLKFSTTIARKHLLCCFLCSFWWLFGLLFQNIRQSSLWFKQRLD